MALMAITNLTAILLLSPVVALIARDYLRQRKLGVQPVFRRLSLSGNQVNKLPLAPGMICRANSAAITAIDPTIQGDFC
ncbi:hypothetical protein MJ588_04590 [Klebsiella pneumoniae]|nr:hypothetical protein MJ588_04590 [Klebsiella pneumoniae]